MAISTKELSWGSTGRAEVDYHHKIIAKDMAINMSELLWQST
jgi:hypothetical protein